MWADIHITNIFIHPKTTSWAPVAFVSVNKHVSDEEKNIVFFCSQAILTERNATGANNVFFFIWWILTWVNVLIVKFCFYFVSFDPGNATFSNIFIISPPTAPHSINQSINQSILFTSLLDSNVGFSFCRSFSFLSEFQLSAKRSLFMRAEKPGFIYKLYISLSSKFSCVNWATLSISQTSFHFDEQFRQTSRISGSTKVRDIPKQRRGTLQIPGFIFKVAGSTQPRV